MESQAKQSGAAGTISVGTGRVLAGLFLSSGAVGLVLQVVWLKRFAQVWGSSALALGAVVGSFLLGNALGAAWLPGRVARTRGLRGPLELYALLELGIALLALLVPLELAALAAAGWTTLGDALSQPGLRQLGRSLCTLAVLVPPCFLMGGTLPALVAVLERSGIGLGASTSRLYSLNSFGAGLGAVLAGFWFLPTVGVNGTTWLACGLGLAVAVVAFGLARGLPCPVPGESGAAACAVGGGSEGEPTLDRVHGSARPRRDARVGASLAAACLAGMGSIALEILWGRELGLLLGGSAYVHAMLLAVFVAGLGLGSALYHRVAPRPERLAAWALAALLALALGTVLAELSLPALARWAGEWRATRASLLGNALVCAAVGAAVQGIATLAMGFLFPALVELAHAARVRAGTSSGSPAWRGSGERTVGRVLTANTAGAVLAAMATSTLVIPRLGVRGGVVAALVLYLFAGAAILVAAPGSARLRTALASFALLLLSVAGFAAWSRTPPDPRLTNMGLYLYGSDRYPDPLASTELLHYAEGATANLLVLEEGEGEHRAVTLRVNGKVDGSSGRDDLGGQTGLGLVPRLFRPAAERVLVIGFGTGTSAGKSLLFPDTRVDCVELEPAMLHVSPFFHAINGRPEASPRFRFIAEDGRAWVQESEEPYDLILSQPTNPWISGVTNLYTREFFETAKAKLGREGLLAQWVQLYAFTMKELASVARTLGEVFEHSLLILVSPTDVVLLASRAPVEPDLARLAAAQSLVDRTPALGDELERALGTRRVPSILMAHTLLDRARLDAMVQAEPGARRITDHNLSLEFDAPRHIFTWDSETRAKEVRLDVDMGVLQRFLLAWSPALSPREALLEVHARYVHWGLTGLASKVVTLGCVLEPEEPFFWGARLRELNPQREAGPLQETAQQLAALSGEASLALGIELAAGGRGSLDYERAVWLLSALVQRRPEYEARARAALEPGAGQ